MAKEESTATTAASVVPKVSHDPVKAAHDARKQAIREEKEARLKRLNNVRQELTMGIEDVTNFHNFLSILELEKHSGKGKGSNELSTAISQIAGALTNVNAYLRGYKDEKENG